MSLEDFIIKHQALLSALGVFTAVVALTAGSKNLALDLVSFVSIGGVVIIGWEIFSKLEKNLSPRLWLFRYVLLWGGAGLILYWLYEFRPLWDMSLWIVAIPAVFAFALWNLLPIARASLLTRKIFGIDSVKKNGWQKFARGTAFTILALTAFYFGAALSFGTNAVLDAIHRQFGN